MNHQSKRGAEVIPCCRPLGAPTLAGKTHHAQTLSPDRPVTTEEPHIETDHIDALPELDLV
jgi:hypothetical protein